MTQLRDWAVSDGVHRIALVGQGGSGKSTLAHWLLNEVGQGLRPSTRLVFLLQAGDLMRGYRELLAELQRLLGREEKQPDKDEDVRRLVHVLLRDGRSWASTRPCTCKSGRVARGPRASTCLSTPTLCG
jgi:ATPase subunit of ABC transporter with duplicated ATPase domains